LKRLLLVLNFGQLLVEAVDTAIVSHSSLLAVKNGWQFEQVSTLISFMVDPVSKVAPQLTQVTLHLW
jgi:hypothetical protein